MQTDRQMDGWVDRLVGAVEHGMLLLSSSGTADARLLTMSNTPEATTLRKELRVALGAEASNVSGKAFWNCMVACRASPATCQRIRHS